MGDGEMIEVVAAVFVLVCLFLVWVLYRVFTDKPTHEDKLDARRAVTLTEQLNKANKIMVKLQVIDSVMPCLPAEIKSELNEYLGGISK